MSTNCASCSDCVSNTQSLIDSIKDTQKTNLVQGITSNQNDIKNKCVLEQVKQDIKKSSVNELFANEIGNVCVPADVPLKPHPRREEITLTSKFNTHYNRCSNGDPVLIEVAIQSAVTKDYKYQALGELAYSTTVPPKGCVPIYIFEKRSEFNSELNEHFPSRLSSISESSEFIRNIRSSLNSATVIRNPNSIEHSNWSASSDPGHVDLGYLNFGIDKVIHLSSVSDLLQQFRDLVISAVRSSEIAVNGSSSITVAETPHRKSALFQEVDKYSSHSRKLENFNISRAQHFYVYKLRQVCCIGYEMRQISFRIISSDIGSINPRISIPSLGIQMKPTALPSASVALSANNLSNRILNSANTLHPKGKIIAAELLNTPVISGRRRTRNFYEIDKHMVEYFRCWIHDMLKIQIADPEYLDSVKIQALGFNKLRGKKASCRRYASPPRNPTTLVYKLSVCSKSVPNSGGEDSDKHLVLWKNDVSLQTQGFIIKNVLDGCNVFENSSYLNSLRETDISLKEKIICLIDKIIQGSATTGDYNVVVELIRDSLKNTNESLTSDHATTQCDSSNELGELLSVNNHHKHNLENLLKLLKEIKCPETPPV